MKNPYYTGPVSDHFDGTRFSNYGLTSDKPFSAIWKWKRQGTRVPWPATRATLPTDTPPERSEGLRVAFVGHASILLQAAGLNILFDPLWSDRASPFRRFGPLRIDPPGIRFDDLPPIDAVLVSHNHYDHMDLATLARLEARDAPRVVTPLGNDAVIHARVPEMRVDTGDWGDRFVLSERVSVTLHPASHWSARGIRDRRMALWSGFVLETPAGTVYHSGDTGYGDGAIFRRVREDFGAPRLALLPIGAYEPRWFMRDQHVSPDESVRIFQDTGARDALGFHWGTFHLADEGIDQPAEALAAALDAAHVPRERFRPMHPGEAFAFP
ncbi:MBL fold metallo-hydrolase [Aureimonas sp. ME7]|uniref:MBL fold metallo-hydrolase n=1 Tax=Aureimonas sp. ME7 TaxID=2744252 RepID=UPI0015F64457|nr:MBL fold metallo-hydrolase [Aureimonas sp. ME7]